MILHAKGETIQSQFEYYHKKHLAAASLLDIEKV